MSARFFYKPLSFRRHGTDERTFSGVSLSRIPGPSGENRVAPKGWMVRGLERFGTRGLLGRQGERRWDVRDLRRGLGRRPLDPEPGGVERRQEQQGEGGRDQQ